MKTKDLVRKEELLRRKNMMQEDLHERSDVLKLKSLALLSQLPEVKTVHIFLPAEKHNEPNTWFLIEGIREEFPFIRICVPVCEWKESNMESYELLKNTTLKHNSLGIPEPVEALLVKPEEIDLIFVPLLAYNAGLHRIGYGKGFYDRYLIRCREDCLKIGLSFFGPSEFAHDELDVALDLVVTGE